MKKLLLFKWDKKILDVCLSFLPTDWQAVVADEGEEVLQLIESGSPELMLVNAVNDSDKAVQMLRDAKSRLESMPPAVFITPEAADDTDEELMELGVVAMVPSPIEPDRLRSALAPFLFAAPPTPMTLVEYLASAHWDRVRHNVSCEWSGGTLGMILEDGGILGLLTDTYRRLWRIRLTDAGFTLPEAIPGVIDDLAAVERGLPKDEGEVVILKQQTLLYALQAIPASQLLKFSERSAVSTTGMIPVPISRILPALIERMPEADLGRLDAPDVHVRRNTSVDVEHLQLTTQEGYILYQCEKSVKVPELLRAVSFPREQALRTIYLLTLLGALETQPDAGQPPRLAVILEGLARERKNIAVQSAAIENLVRSFETPGLNPSLVLGLPQDADYNMARNVHDTLQERFRSENLHPEINRKYQKDLVFLRAKLGEAFLVLQTAFIEERQRQKEAGKGNEGQALGDAAAVEGEGRQVEQVSEERRKESERLYLHARELYAQKREYESSQYLRLALFHNPQSAPCHHLMGKIYTASRHPRAKYLAEKSFLDAVRLDPWELTYLIDLAYFYLHNGQVVRCRSYLERAQHLNPKDPTVGELKKALKEY
ncbi:MAG: hypothetical protein P8Z49_02560 [Acidobacteriota bacterium]